MNASQSKVDILIAIIQAVADENATFFEVKGPGAGDLHTNRFIAEIKERARTAFNEDFSEHRICKNNGFAVDYYFRDEETIVEIALGLKNPGSEFEKDILKALMAKDNEHPVQHLVLIGKPGAERRCAQPGRQGFIDWARTHHQLSIKVCDIKNISDADLSDNIETED
jgi:hypothetical protein